jgi:hypothetical protein
MLLRAICALILSGILVAGLWPFHRPKNEVSWSANNDGLLFGKYGSIVSAAPFGASTWQTNDSCSIEILLRPRRANASGTIFASYWPENRVIPFALRQSLGDLELLHRSDDLLHHAKSAKLYVDNLFLSRQWPVLATISTGQSGTTIYADGTLVKKAPNFRFSSQELTGQLVIGNAPTTTDNWSGQLMGLALYDRELTADDVSQHYQYWKYEQASLAESEGMVGLYLFDEGKGSVVHNQVGPATDLVIPDRFFVLHEQFLERPWSEFRSDWNYWKDVGINIVGFIPLGFFFCAYFSLKQTTKWVLASAVAFGLAISLTIEILQAFLPTRDSGITDLITNTLGTALGAILYAGVARHHRFAPAGGKVPPLSEEM